MASPAVKIAKLNDNRYEVSLESEHGLLKCYVRAKLPGRQLPEDDAAREAERKQLALKRAGALAKAFNAAIIAA